MPIKRGYQTIEGVKKGYYRYGEQKKYYYEIGNKTSRENALNLAQLQRKAIKASESRKYR